MPQGSSPFANRLRGLFNTILVVGSVLASLAAVSVVVGLFWWVSPQPPRVPQAALQPPHPATAPAAVASQRDARREAQPKQAAAAAQPRPAVGTAPVAPAPAAEPEAEVRPNPDAQQNRAIAAGLSRLAQDPEAQRRVAESAAAEQPE